MYTLRNLAESVRIRCSLELERHGSVWPLAVVVHGELCRYATVRVEAHQKPALYEALAEIVQEEKPTALIYCETGLTLVTPEKNRKLLTDSQWAWFLQQGPEWLLEYGYAKPQECIDVTAQDSEMFCSLMTPFQRCGKRIVWEEPKWLELPQSAISPETNLLKFYGR